MSGNSLRNLVCRLSFYEVSFQTFTPSTVNFLISVKQCYLYNRLYVFCQSNHSPPIWQKNMRITWKNHRKDEMSSFIKHVLLPKYKRNNDVKKTNNRMYETFYSRSNTNVETASNRTTFIQQVSGRSNAIKTQKICQYLHNIENILPQF